MAKQKKKAPAKKRPETGIAVRPKSKAPAKSVVISGLPAPALSPVGQLGELATVGALGLAELKLTPEEETVLAEPVNPADIRFKPRKKDGPPEIPYLPHYVYTRWFNRAFGRTGWSIVPTAQPKKVDNLVLVPYLLYVHGVPIAAAMGEQEYYEANKQQTYGDVIESTVASALRRCAKRLAVGLEMWDKDWLEVHAVPPHKRGRKSSARRDDDYIDADPVYESEPERDMVGAPVPVPYITPQQQKRLGDIAKRMGRNYNDVKLWLRKRWGVESSAAIKQSDYAEVCRQLEARGDLVIPGDGE